jgi:hypothetical protein
LDVRTTPRGSLRGHDDLDWLRRNPNAPERETPQNEHAASVTIN